MIILNIPEGVYNRYKKMTKNQKIEVTSIYFPSVLLSIINEQFCGGGSEYTDRKWYGAIRDSIDNRGIIPSDNDPYIVTMAIIGDLLTEGVGYIPVVEEVNQ